MTAQMCAAYRAKRARLLISSASAAMAAVALHPQQARAQAFQGTITGTLGSVDRTVTSGTSETITVGSSTATNNWAPTNNNGTGTINFLPSGNQAIFTSAAGLTDYTVLNRIVPTDPTRAILLDGSVVSTVQGSSTIGGNVWFYSPGGIVIGSNAVFDVGGLLLTSLDVPGFTADAGGFAATFAKTQTSAGAIQILSGAKINAVSVDKPIDQPITSGSDGSIGDGPGGTN